MKVPLITDENAWDFFFPGRPKPAKRALKVIIYYIDGHTDEMKLTFPFWTSWGEPNEIAEIVLSQFVFHLSNCFIDPERFEIFHGTINDNGEERYSNNGHNYEIPLERVFVSAKGRWVKPEDKWSNPDKG